MTAGMNKQLKLYPDGKIKSRGIEWTDWTLNFISGCLHGCRWKMDDGVVAECYAEGVAETIASPAYPQGFEHYYWKPELLASPLKLKETARIFAVSMGDLYGGWVPKEHIDMVHESFKKASWHHFQTLTKAPHRLKDFTFPDNQWVGASCPADFMGGVELNFAIKCAKMHKTMQALEEARHQHRAKTTWISLEPLSINWSGILQEYPRSLDWAVIGAASNGKTYYAPEEKAVRECVEVLDAQGVPIFFKGNMKSLKWAADNWREEMPAIFYNRPSVNPPDAPKPTQLTFLIGGEIHGHQDTGS